MALGLEGSIRSGGGLKDLRVVHEGLDKKSDGESDEEGKKGVSMTKGR